MNETLLNHIDDLKKEIKNTKEYIALMEANEALENSDEVKVLSYKKDMAIMNYEDALSHFDKNSKEVLKAEKEMGKAIYNLNHHELVIIYNKAFKEVEKIYNKINKELFSDFMERIK